MTNESLPWLSDARSPFAVAFFAPGKIPLKRRYQVAQRIRRTRVGSSPPNPQPIMLASDLRNVAPYAVRVGLAACPFEQRGVRLQRCHLSRQQCVEAHAPPPAALDEPRYRALTFRSLSSRRISNAAILLFAERSLKKQLPLARVVPSFTSDQERRM
jgi:hypothetical protein